MKKYVWLLGISLIVVMLTFTSCKEKDNNTVKGTVSIANDGDTMDYSTTTLILTNTETGAKFEKSADADGNYSFSEVDDGSFYVYGLYTYTYGELDPFYYEATSDTFGVQKEEIKTQDLLMSRTTSIPLE